MRREQRQPERDDELLLHPALEQRRREELRVVDANASESVASHPAFVRMRAAVVEKLETLHSEVMEARAVYQANIEAANGGPPKDEHMIYASDLVAILGVTELEAEEMIFIADLKENSAIDFTEFRQVVVNWS